MPKKRKEPRKRVVPKTDPDKVLDRVKISGYVRRGWSIYRIAEHLGVSFERVRQEYRAIIANLVSFDEAEAREKVALKLEELGEVKSEAWEGWEKSKSPEVTDTVEEEEGGDGNVREKRIKRTRGQVGDPTFLQTVLRCIKEECELRGLYPPKEAVVGVQPVIPWDELAASLGGGPVPDEVERRVAALLTPPAPLIIEGAATPPSIAEEKPPNGGGG